MAFVYRSIRQLDNNNTENPTTQIIGPTTYNQHKEYKFQQSYAPFNSTQKRDGIVNEKQLQASPGPGSYQLNLNGFNEKVVVQSPNEDIKIVEVPKPTNVFKSGTKRFDQQKKLSELPGPGQYQLPTSITVKQQPQLKDKEQKDKIVEQIMHLNNYHPIPSIPSRKNVFGYTENENNNLELNKNPQTIYSGTTIDSVGPGQYNNVSFEQKKELGPTWHKYKEQRFKNQQQTLHDLGPGSYELSINSKPLYKLKQSPGFASQSLRYMDQRKGMIANQNLKQRYAKSQQNLLQQYNQDDNDEDEDQEYIEDAIPGPGSYHNENLTSSIKLAKKQEKFQFFGSSQDRFKSEVTNSSTNVGPADYNVNSVNAIGNKLHPIKVRNPPFLSSNTRFEMKMIALQTPGPGAYSSIVSLEDKLKNKIKKGYKGENFGYLEERFKNIKDVDDAPGPGAYIQPIKEEIPLQQGPSSVFKSNEKRSLYDSTKQIVPPVGAYDINHYDIKKNIVDKSFEEEDPDIKIKKPPFNSSEPRFIQRHKSQEQIDFDKEDESNIGLPQITKDKKITDLFKKQPKLNAPFNSKQQRFNYENQVVKLPGPGQYHDSTNNPWNKRTYNILYAEI